MNFTAKIKCKHGNEIEQIGERSYQVDNCRKCSEELIIGHYKNNISTLEKEMKSLNQQIKETQSKLDLVVETLENLINKTEYGVNQWQLAWSPEEETEAQKAIINSKQVISKVKRE